MTRCTLRARLVTVALALELGGCFDPTGDDPSTTLGTDDTGADGGDDPTAAGDDDPSGSPTGADDDDDAGDDDPSGATEPGDDDDADPTGDPSDDGATDDGATDDGATDDGATDDDPTDDTGPAACDGTCVPDVPAGWDGPVVVHEGAGAPPSCPGEFPALVHDELHTGLQPGAASCDCDCGDVVGASCGAATLQEAGNLCIAVVLDPEEFVLAPLACVFVNQSPGEMNVIPPALSTAGASCTPQASESIPTPTWNGSVRSCGVPEGDACDGGTCAPTPGGEFDRTCIWIAGDASCPAGPYSESFQAYGDYADDRDCTACTCGSPTGVCDGEVVLTDVSCGGGALYVDSIAAGACWDVGNGYSHAQWFPEVDASCAPGGGNLQGDVEPTETVTYCCLP